MSSEATQLRDSEYEMTKEDWVALHALLFGLAKVVCTKGVQGLSPEVRAVLAAIDLGEAKTNG